MKLLSMFKAKCENETDSIYAFYPGYWTVNVTKGGTDPVDSSALTDSSPSADSNSVYVPVPVPNTLNATDGDEISASAPQVTLTCYESMTFSDTKVDFYDNNTYLGEATPN